MMERIKKTVRMVMTTGETTCTGMTGNCYIIIPDLTANYFFKIGFKSKMPDWGIFDAIDPTTEPIPPEPPEPTETYYYVDEDDAVFEDVDGAKFTWT